MMSDEIRGNQYGSISQFIVETYLKWSGRWPCTFLSPSLSFSLVRRHTSRTSLWAWDWPMWPFSLFLPCQRSPTIVHSAASLSMYTHTRISWYIIDGISSRKVLFWVTIISIFYTPHKSQNDCTSTARAWARRTRPAKDAAIRFAKTNILRKPQKTNWTMSMCWCLWVFVSVRTCHKSRNILMISSWKK